MQPLLIRRLVMASTLLASASCSTSWGEPVTLGVSSTLLHNMDLFSQYSAAIYCNNNAVGRKGALISCGAANTCPEVEELGATIYGNFYNVGLYSGTGVLAVDHSNKQLILAFRGAELLGQTTVLLGHLIPCEAVCKTCNCHQGLYTSWLEIRDQAFLLVESASNEYPHYSLVVTGHSLGAAQSGYAAAELRANGTKATLYNYGGPHLGDAEFANFVSGQGGNYRTTHTNDPAPHIGDPSAGYRHISPEYWIYQDRNENYTVSTNQILVIPGINSDVGNQGAALNLQSPHVEYFQPQLGACFTTIPPGT